MSVQVKPVIKNQSEYEVQHSLPSAHKLMDFNNRRSLGDIRLSRWVAASAAKASRDETAIEGLVGLTSNKWLTFCKFFGAFEDTELSR